MPVERRLVSIMFTDIEGYTSVMSKDESKAIGILKKKGTHSPKCTLSNITNK